MKELRNIVFREPAPSRLEPGGRAAIAGQLPHAARR